jgi:putative tryptophan/tyrosine transport system substrate-binding protein
MAQATAPILDSTKCDVSGAQRKCARCRFQPLSKCSFESLRCGLLSLVSDMQRRDFVKLLGGTAAVWPLAAGAQMGNKLPTIAVLGDLASVWNPWTAAFADRMGELGWIAGRNIAIEYRWSEGRQAAVAEIAAEFVRQKVDVIVTYGGAVTILKQATSIPIVFAIAVDPVGIGLVASLSHPGGNATGLSIQTTDLAGKRLELFRELVPGLRRLAIIFDAGYPAAVLASREVQAVARTFGLEVAPHEIRRVEDIAPVFDLLKTKRMQFMSLKTPSLPLTASNSQRLRLLRTYR